MDLDDLRAIAEKERAAQKAVRIRCCTAAGCLSSGSKAVIEGAGGGHRRGRPGRHGPGRRGRLHAPLLRGPPGPGRSRRPALREGDAGRTPRRSSPPWTADGRGRGGATRTAPSSRGRWPSCCENSGRIEPERIESYIEAGGYQSLYHVLREMSPAEVVEEITRSGLRGRGGAGYPTGVKWGMVAKQPAGRKFVVCNADEGDPGAFMDRSVLESDPHRVLEGMAIAAYAVGASQGYIYVRGEYPAGDPPPGGRHQAGQAARPARQPDLRVALRLQDRHPDRRRGLRLRRGDGPDRLDRGQARHAPPAAPVSGRGGPLGLPDADQQRRDLRQRPADHPQRRRLVRRHRHGEEQGDQGLRPGRQDQVTPAWSRCRWAPPCGRSSRRSAAGSPTAARSRRCRPAAPPAAASRPSSSTRPSITSRWRRLGSIMGSGGMIVMDEDTNMVDVARFFMEFCMDESCGKCIPCRAGTVQMHRLLTRIGQGVGTRADLDELEGLCDMVKHTSLCGLGQSAPNPVLSTLRYFRDEYEALIQDGTGPESWSARRPTGSSTWAGQPTTGPISPRHAREFPTPREADDHGGQDAHDRRQAHLRPRGPDDPRRGARGRHRDPDALPPRRGLRRRRLPALPGRGRGEQPAPAGLRHRASPRAWRSGPTPSGSASTGG